VRKSIKIHVATFLPSIELKHKAYIRDRVEEKRVYFAQCNKCICTHCSMNIKQYGAFIYFIRDLFNDLLNMTDSGSHSSEYKD
jgi:hypothetical protein